MTLLASNQPRLASPPRGADERRRVSSLLFASLSLSDAWLIKIFLFQGFPFSLIEKVEEEKVEEEEEESWFTFRI